MEASNELRSKKSLSSRWKLEFILALREKAGSSPYAIAKFVEENHKSELPGNFKKLLTSYKLSDASKKEKAPKSAVEKKPKTPKVAAATKPKAVKKSEPVAKKAVKKVVKLAKKTAKSTPVKRKQLKSIKSPVTKKGKKA
ncbi:hypothetical protein ACHQM5_018333 [Ranunculus cassubicifolius]